ncbi:thiamine pyrophosphate-requiring protein [Aliihoeflea sp. PC F10.4]
MDTSTDLRTEKSTVTGAESLLKGMKRSGIDYIFANSGTDFPPIIEAFAKLHADDVPVPVTVPHETASVGMAHGYYLATGRVQATMVHVNVGLANSAMGIINAASDNVPVVVMSGRTPITEHGRRGSRVTPIQYGQEMYDQSSLVADSCKFHYEMRYPEQGDQLAVRATALAMSEPRGPVYVSLPREPLMETLPATITRPASIQAPASPAFPDPAAIGIASDWLASAQNPVIICQRSDVHGKAAAALSRFAAAFAIPVVEPFSVRNVLASDDAMLLGYDIKQALAQADVVVVLDSDIPWMESLHRPASDTRIVHIGPDPLFARMPIRGYQADLSIVSDMEAGILALETALAGKASANEERRAKIAARSKERLAAAENFARSGNGSPMSAEWLSLCLSDVLGDDGIVFSELGVVPPSMRLKGPNRVFTAPHSGGLGWGMPAALGAQLADRSRLVVAVVGDGSYMFANPVACHQIAEALGLPILTIVKNNGIWNAVRRSVVGAYPDGAAVKANEMPLTSLEPSPAYTQIAGASRAYTERVETGADLPAALSRAIEVIRTESRQAMLEVKVEQSDRN